jgi:hypothetical protein
MPMHNVNASIIAIGFLKKKVFTDLSSIFTPLIQQRGRNPRRCVPGFVLLLESECILLKAERNSNVARYHKVANRLGGIIILDSYWTVKSFQSSFCRAGQDNIQNFTKTIAL